MQVWNLLLLLRSCCKWEREFISNMELIGQDGLLVAPHLSDDYTHCTA